MGTAQREGKRHAALFRRASSSRLRGGNRRIPLGAAAEPVTIPSFDSGFPFRKDRGVRLRSRWLGRAAGWCAARGLRLLARTCRFDVHPQEPGTNPRDPACPRHYLYILWHDTLLLPAMSRHVMRGVESGNRVTALVSQHRDGGTLLPVLQAFWIDAVRGSSKRGGVGAVRQLLALTRESHVFLTPDGPRGPRRQVKDGILFLASQTGVPIIPVGAAASREWRVRGSWTDQAFPLPGAYVRVELGRPMEIPRALPREEYEPYRRRLEGEMERVMAIAAEAVGRVPEQTSEASEAGLDARKAA